ncbi:Thiamine-monophosphate kinase [Mucinivorans hirudinis]|uniref:Thiamine-monophosphate kinase n=1 Tax=Mucinivorans hirudinis TaxID=1433126 RepID=A0A060R851_9BACT|nr:Thiamine-monophosphate kinase [Mucinivorans hirudinis]
MQTRTQIAELGKVNFIEKLTSPFAIEADDAAILDNNRVIASDMLLEGVDFDLQYTPLEHLGYKAVTAAASNILAMNAMPKEITISLGLSARFSVEESEALYKGVHYALDQYGIRLIGGNTSASMSGLVIATTCIGTGDNIVRRSGAKTTDLLCITGNLGAAYMGMQLLEREKRAVGKSGIMPQLEGYNYLLRRQLQPTAPISVVKNLATEGVVPTAMIDITNGLASAMLSLCQSSQCGARIYLERIPIASEVFKLAQELQIDPVVAALNGGDDFELLFTVPLEHHKEILTMAGVDVIGHVVAVDEGAAMVTPDGSEIRLQSPDFVNQM